MDRKVYVAGKVSGLPKDEVKDKFNKISKRLMNLGYHVVRPAAVYDDSKAWDVSIKNDIRKMLDCDELHMLPDWQQSRGAQLERDIALRLGMQVVYH